MRMSVVLQCDTSSHKATIYYFRLHVSA